MVPQSWHDNNQAALVPNTKGLSAGHWLERQCSIPVDYAVGNALRKRKGRALQRPGWLGARDNQAATSGDVVWFCRG